MAGPSCSSTSQVSILKVSKDEVSKIKKSSISTLSSVNHGQTSMVKFCIFDEIFLVIHSSVGKSCALPLEDRQDYGFLKIQQ